MFSITRRSIISHPIPTINPSCPSKALSSFTLTQRSSRSILSPSRLSHPTFLSVSKIPIFPIKLSSPHHAFSVSTRDLNSTAALRARTNTEQSPPSPETTEASNQPATKPFSSIESYVSPALYRAVTQSPFGYSHMSAVQDQLLSDLPNLIQTTQDGETKTKDLLVKAKTGTGKTLAFLIPAIESRLRDLEAERARFQAHNPEASHQNLINHMRRYEAETTGIVVMSPTRELATQIAHEAVKLTSHIKQFGIRLFVGGASKSVQLREWDNGRRDIVVATPGRLNDVLNSSPSVRQNLSTTKTLIMDEADTLLEMGFKEEIDQIVQQLPPKEERSTYLFSATVSPEIHRIARQTMKADTKIIDCVPSGESNVHAHVPQYYTVLPTPDQQIKHIFNLIAHDQLTNPSGKTVIFLPTTKMTQMFSHLISSLRRYLPWNSAGLTRVYEMHGTRTQRERENIAQDFRNGAGGAYQILVTSDVSARGVDYPGVTKVIQVGVPTTRDIYVHRVGRTGRAGKAGRGDLVLLPFEAGYISNTLRQIPIKPLSVKSLNDELIELGTKIDQSGQAPVLRVSAQRAMIRDRRSFKHHSHSVSNSQEDVRMQLPVVQRIKSFEENFRDNIMPSIGEESIKDSFGSLLGYYVGRAGDIGADKETILNGLKQWSVEGMLLPEEPYVSDAFLQKLGFNSSTKFGGNNSGGRRNWGRDGGNNNRAWGGGMRGGDNRFNDRNSHSGGYPRSHDRNSRPSGFASKPRSYDRNDRPKFDRRSSFKRNE